MTEPRRYQREVHADADDSLSRIARRIPPGSTVLDLGLGSGALGRYLSTQKGCPVDGVDLEPAADASAHYRRLLVADLETADLGALLGVERYDVIVCADVIEHVRGPERLVGQLPALLAPGGRVLLSVPNVAHAGVLASLLSGEFPYTREGLLDATHVRFFTRRSLLQLLRDVGLTAAHLESVVVDVNASEFRERYIDAMSPVLRNALLARADALTYQFVVEATPAPGAASIVERDGDTAVEPAELEFGARLYWRTRTDTYREDASASSAGVVGRARQTLVFRVPADAAPERFRLDPADRPGYVRLHALRALDAAGRRAWEWDGSVASLERGARASLELAEAPAPDSGVVAVLTGSDAWIELDLPLDATRSVAGGAFEAELSWPASTDYLALASRLLDSGLTRNRIEALTAELAESARSLELRRAEVREVREALEDARAERSLAAMAAVREWGVVRDRVAGLAREFATSRAWRIGDRVGELSLRLRRRPPAMLTRQLEEAAADLVASSMTDVDDLARWLDEQRWALERFHAQAAQCINSKRYRLGRRLTRLGALARLRFSSSSGEQLAATFPLAFGVLDAARAASVAAPADTGACSSAAAIERACGGALVPHERSADIVVCVHDAPEDTRNCLSSLVEHTTPPYRVILVDDGSAGETSAILGTFAEEQGATLLRNEAARGYTFAANQGLRASSADYVVLLNSDTVVTPGWLDRIVACGESDPLIGAVGPLSNCASWQSIPQQLGPDGDWAQNPLPAGLSVAEMGERVARHSSRAYPRVPFLNGFCYAVKRSAIERIGYFDEEHFGAGFHEENDYSLRLARAGFTLAVADDAYVFHHQSRSYSSERRKALSERSGQMLGRLHSQAVIEQRLQTLQSDLSLAGIRARQAVALEAWAAQADARRRCAGRRVAFVLPAQLVSSSATTIVQQAAAMRDAFGVDARVVGTRTQQREYKRVHGGLATVEWAEDPEVLVAGLDRYDAVVAAGTSSADVVGRLPPSTRVAWQLGFEAEQPTLAAARNRVVIAATAGARMSLAAGGASPPLVHPGVDTRLFAPRRRVRLDGDATPTVKVVAAAREGLNRRASEATLRVLARAHEQVPGRLEVVVLGRDPRRSDGALPPDGWRFVSGVARTELAALLGDADVFLDLESAGVGLLALEALASGAACVVARHSTIAGLVHADAVTTVDHSDERASLRALMRLVTDASERAALARRGIGEGARLNVVNAVLALLGLLFPEVP